MDTSKMQNSSTKTLTAGDDVRLKDGIDAPASVSPPAENGVTLGPEDLEVPLFDPVLLKDLDWSLCPHMKNGVTSSQPGPGLIVRPLCKADYERGFLQLLAQLTVIGDTSREMFNARFDTMRRCEGHYFITVIEDTDKGAIVGAATLAVELKFIRGCAKRGRLEDVVVSDAYRGKQLGKLIVSTVGLLARSAGCYKIGLDCKDDMKPFYSSLGYKGESGNDSSMVIRF